MKNNSNFIAKNLAPILQNAGIDKLNAMQLQTIEQFPTSNENILLAPTGSGKTLAFLLPLYLQLKENAVAGKVNAIIVAPTRELALQIQEVWKSMQTGMKSVACYGGHKIQTEINELVETPLLIIGTPGRLLDHLSSDYLDASAITRIVLDEFDKVLEFGFLEEVGGIVEKLTSLQHKVLASATELHDIPELLNIQNPNTLNFLSVEKNNKVKKYLLLSEDKDKIHTLTNLLLYGIKGTAIVFVNHREAAARIHELLATELIDSIVYHGGLEQLERELAIIKFKNGTVDLLIASDIASRGLDMDAIGNIIHYHMPDSEEAYIHRNGRTARQDASGNIFVIQHSQEKLPSFIEEDDLKEFILKENESRNWQSNWITLTVNAGKKNKINKVDILGFIGNNAKLAKLDIGIIQVLDTVSFVAVPKEKYKDILAAIRNKKIKGKDFIFRVAK